MDSHLVKSIYFCLLPNLKPCKAPETDVGAGSSAIAKNGIKGSIIPRKRRKPPYLALKPLIFLSAVTPSTCQERVFLTVLGARLYEKE